jgi:hypothetical protein
MNITNTATTPTATQANAANGIPSSSLPLVKILSKSENAQCGTQKIIRVENKNIFGGFHKQRSSKYGCHWAC